MDKIKMLFILMLEEAVDKIAAFVTFFIPGNHLKSIVRGHILRLKIKKVGNKFTLDRGVTINYPRMLSIGNCVYFAKDVWINAHYGVTIGSNVQLSPMVVIATGNHNISESGITDNGKNGSVVIGSNVWISSHCTISAGVTIGNNVIIAANSVVLHDIPNNVFVAGVPCKIIRNIN